MATETLILRPTSTIEASVTGVVPDTTPVENYYMLVNEVTCDEDATYISITDNQDYIVFGFDCSHIQFSNYNITDIELNIFGLIPNNTYAFNAVVDIYDINNVLLNSMTYVFPKVAIELTNTYNIMSIYLSDTQLDIVNKNQIGYLSINYSVPKVGSGKSVTSKISQLYLNFVLEEKPAATLPPTYLKINGVWINISSLSCYKRNNETWEEYNLSTLLNNDRYIIKELNGGV